MRIRFSILILAVLLLFTACSSASDSNTSLKPGDIEAAEGGGFNEWYDPEYGAADNAPIPEGALVRKMIQTGELTLQADDVTVAYEDYLAYIESVGGYLFSCSYNSYGGSADVEAVFKLPPDALTTAMQYAGNYAEVLHSRTNSEDITEAYYDAETRLTTMEKTLEQYYTLLEQAKSIDDILSIQRTIDNITTEIEALKGQLRVYDSRVDEATLSVYISATPKIIEEDVDWNSLSFKDMGRLIANGFKTVVNGLWSVLQWLIIILVSASPILIPTAVIVGIVLWRRQVKRKKNAEGSLQSRQGNDLK